MFKVVVFNYSE